MASRGEGGSCGHHQVTFGCCSATRAAIEEALEQPWDEVMFDFGEIAVSGERFVEAARLAGLSSGRLGPRLLTQPETVAARVVDGL